MKIFKSFGLLIQILITFVIFFGYGLNIYKLSQCDFNFSKSNKAEIIRIIGIATPLGIIFGYIDFSEENGDL